MYGNVRLAERAHMAPVSHDDMLVVLTFHSLCFSIIIVRHYLAHKWLNLNTKFNILPFSLMRKAYMLVGIFLGTCPHTMRYKVKSHVLRIHNTSKRGGTPSQALKLAHKPTFSYLYGQSILSYPTRILRVKFVLSYPSHSSSFSKIRWPDPARLLCIISYHRTMSCHVNRG